MTRPISTFQTLTRFMYTVLCCGILAACASAPMSVQTPSSIAESPPAPTATELSPETRIDRQTLFEILSGEIAARRMLGQQASQYMTAAMQRQPDQELAIRSARIAHFFNDDEALDLASKMWRDFDNKASEPLYLQAVTYTRQGRLSEAFDLMEQLLNMGADTNFTAIVSAVSQYPEHGPYLHSAVKRLRQHHPQNLHLALSDAILADASGQSEQALKSSQEALEIAPDSYAAFHLKARSLQILERQQEAIDTLLTALELYPETTKMRLHLARMLTSIDLKEASEQFAILVEQAPQDANYRLSLALSLKESDQIDAAIEQFNTLLDLGEYSDEANYYLALIYRDKAPQIAGDFCLDIGRSSPYFMPGIALFLEVNAQNGYLMSAIERLQTLWHPEDERSANIALLTAQHLVKIGMANEAQHLLERAIEQLKQRVEMRYTLALMLQQQGELENAQALLETNILEQPQHAASLNALGYLLAEKGLQLSRAETLISRAIELRPNDPAIIDSMGWVLFKQGKHESAAQYLGKAHQLLADPEIASHLVEVLWHLNRHIEASDILQDALQRFPENKMLQDTQQRIEFRPQFVE